MGSNPFIPQAPPIQDPLQQYGRMMQLRSLAQQQQLGQQQLIGAQQENQMRQMQLNDQQAMRQAYIDSQGDPDKFLANVKSSKYGVSFNGIMSATQGMMQMRKAYMDMSKEQLGYQQQIGDTLQGAHDRVLQAPAEQRPQLYQQELQKLGPLANGLPPQYPGDDAFQQMGFSLKTASQMREQALKERTVGAQELTAQARAASAQTSANRLQAQLPGGPLADVTRTEMTDWLQKNPGKTPADFMAYQKTIVPRLTFNLQASGGANAISPQQAQKSGPDFLSTVSRGDQGVLQALSTGRMSLPSSFALRTPYWQRIIAELNQYDPGFNEQRAQVRKAFATGPDGKNIGALNTATVHLDTLGQMADALNNKDMRTFNALVNAAKTEFGGSAPTNFNGVKSAVAGEMAAALKGNATDIEIANISKDISSKNTPAQLQDYINAQMHILGQKLNTYKQRYNQYIPNDPVWSPILPQAQAVFNKHGVAEGGGQAQPAVAAKAPAVGAVEQGYKFKGGDPSKPENWEKQ